MLRFIFRYATWTPFTKLNLSKHTAENKVYIDGKYDIHSGNICLSSRSRYSRVHFLRYSQYLSRVSSTMAGCKMYLQKIIRRVPPCNFPCKNWRCGLYWVYFILIFKESWSPGKWKTTTEFILHAPTCMEGNIENAAGRSECIMLECRHWFLIFTTCRTMRQNTKLLEGEI